MIRFILLIGLILSNLALAQDPTLHARAAKGNITLYRHGTECVFYIQGTTRQGQTPLNAALWFPAHPAQLYVSAKITDPIALFDRYEHHQKLLLKGYIRHPAKHFLMADNGDESYKDLLGVSDGSGRADLFEADFTKPIDTMLTGSKLFVVKLKKSNSKEFLSTVFELSNFKRLYQDYQKTC